MLFSAKTLFCRGGNAVELVCPNIYGIFGHMRTRFNCKCGNCAEASKIFRSPHVRLVCSPLSERWKCGVYASQDARNLATHTHSNDLSHHTSSHEYIAVTDSPLSNPPSDMEEDLTHIQEDVGQGSSILQQSSHTAHAQHTASTSQLPSSPPRRSTRQSIAKQTAKQQGQPTPTGPNYKVQRVLGDPYTDPLQHPTISLVMRIQILVRPRVAMLTNALLMAANNASTQLSILSLNVRYINMTRREPIESYLSSHNNIPTIMCLQELHTHQPNISSVNRHYYVYTLAEPRLRTASTTQCIIVHKRIPHQPLPALSQQTIDYSMQWVLVRTSTAHILLCNVYRAPNRATAIWQHIFHNIQQARQAHPDATLLLVGDFNARLRMCGDMQGATTHPLLHSPQAADLHILNALHAYGMPTYRGYDARSSSILDLAISTDPTILSSLSVGVDGYSFDSDHKPLLLTLATHHSLSAPVVSAPHYRWRVDRLNTDLFASHMDALITQQAASFHSLLATPSQHNIDIPTGLLIDIFIQSASFSCPYTEVKPGHKPWWSLIPNRDALHTAYLQARRQYLRSPANRANPALKLAYTQAQQAWVDAIRIAKQLQHQQFIEQLDASPTQPFHLFDDPVSQASLKRKLWWAHVKRTTKPSSFGIGLVNSATGEIPGDIHQSLNNTAAYFQSISNLPQDTVQYHTHVANSIPTILQQCSNASTPAASLPFTLTALSEMCQKLPTTAAGPDDIQTAFIRASTASMHQLLYTLFSSCWRTGLVPTQFTLAKVVPLHKDGAKTVASNYRPISITSLLIRMYERLLCPYYTDRILPLTSAYQSGFRPGYSTSDNIHRIVEVIHRTIRRKQRRYLLSIDLRKAFDTVWTDNLLHILHTQFNITGNAWLFLKAFLNNRRFFVVSDNSSSDIFDLFAGVPQGSVLAPILFIAYINSLAILVRPYATSALFADDSNMWSRSTGRKGLREIRQAADCVTIWCIRYKLTVNVNKCSVTVLSSNRSIANHTPQILLHSQPVTYSSTLKVLGITVQGNGRWDAQFAQLYARCTGLSASIARMCSPHIHTPPQSITIATVVKMVLIPTIAYGIEHWRPTQQQMAKLQSLIANPLKRALHAPISASTIGVLLEFGIPTLTMIRQARMLLYMHRTITNPNIIDHLARNSLRRQSADYLHRSLRYSSSPAYARTAYVEAQHIAGTLFGVRYRTPDEWTKPRIYQAIAEHMQVQALSAIVGRSIYNNHPSATSTALALQPAPYILHEQKPFSIARAHCRLRLLRTPARLRTMQLIDSAQCPYCVHAYADIRHLLLHCPQFRSTRTAIRDFCRIHRFKYNYGTLLGHFMPCSDHPS